MTEEPRPRHLPRETLVQVDGLLNLQIEMHRHGWPVPPIVIGLGDVPVLSFTRSVEIVIADGIDIWDGKGIAQSDVSKQEAFEALLADIAYTTSTKGDERGK